MESEESQAVILDRSESPSPPSSEQIALWRFANQLGSCNFSSEPGIGDDTRQEATLLMSLLASNPTSSEVEMDPAYSSDSSQGSRREIFHFTCPSLSLEPGTDSTLAGQKRSAPSNGSSCGDLSATTTTTTSSATSEHTLPASLLRRPLKLDDRDALRLSADAMARNIRQSYQEAIQWRIQSWTRALSKCLVSMEKEMLENGASKEHLKDLLHTREACLLVALNEVASTISVTGAGTSFRVLPDRLENNSNAVAGSKRRRLDSVSDIEETEEYLYSVTHALVLACCINLQTPAGYSEVSLDIPGTMEGVFHCGGNGMEEMKSVVVDVNTDILAAMIEKSCRNVVRVCTEVVVESISASMPPAAERTPSQTSVSSEEEVTETDMNTTMTPTRPSRSSPENGFAAIVTPPRVLFSPRREETHSTQTAHSVIMPIPEDFDEPLHKPPRRISPQPGSPTFESSSLFTPQTPNKSHLAQGLPLISPPPNENQEYQEVPENGPSLPVLVEVACRAMEAN